MFKLSLNTVSDYKIWVVSDLHIAHGKDFILKPRGYNTVQEAQDHTWEMMHKYIGPNDVIINIGDAICGAGDQTNSIASRIVHFPCKAHYYIWGNHNAGMQQIYDNIRREKGLLSDNIEQYPLRVTGTGFVFVGDVAEFTINGLSCVFFHYPIASWNEIGKGSFMIHGHCHRNMKEDRSLKRLDVSWDWKKRPVEWSEIVSELSSRKFVAIDHHGKDEPKSEFFE